MSDIKDSLKAEVRSRMNVCSKINNSIKSIPESLPKPEFGLPFWPFVDSKGEGRTVTTIISQMYSSVLESLKFKDKLKDGAVKSLENQAKALDQHYQISNTTTRVASNVGEKGKEVFADAKKQDPTGILTFVEKYVVETWCYFLGSGSNALEQVAQLHERDMNNEEGVKPSAEDLQKKAKVVEESEGNEMQQGETNFPKNQEQIVEKLLENEAEEKGGAVTVDNHEKLCEDSQANEGGNKRSQTILPNKREKVKDSPGSDHIQMGDAYVKRFSYQW